MKTIINNSDTTTLLNRLEKEVLHMMAYDYTVGEMMLELSESYEIIKSTQANLCQKLQVEHKAGLIRVAYEEKILVLYESV